MEDCLLIYGIAFALFMISVIFIIMTINLQNSLDSKNLVKFYDIKKNETLTTVTDIRKNDGTSCNITTIYENGKYTPRKTGTACK